MKRSLILISIISALSITACSDNTNESSVAVEEAKQKQSQTQQTSQQTKDNSKNTKEEQFAEYFSYDSLGIERAKDNPELYSLIQEDISTYEEHVKKIITDFEKEMDIALVERQENLEELQSTLSDQQTEFNNNCEDPAPADIDYCNQLGMENAELKTTINKVKSDIKNTEKRLRVQRTNLLNQYQNQMQNNVLNLLHQGGLIDKGELTENDSENNK